MSNLARGNKDDYPLAAKKHLTDAKQLLDAARFDGAAYLAGYAIECSLRTVVMMGYMRKLADEEAEQARRPAVPLGRAFAKGSRALVLKSRGADEAQSRGRDHDIVSLAEATTGYKDVLADGTACYVPSADMKKLPFYDLKKFTDIRYRGEGVMVGGDAEKWVAEATTIYEACVGRMILDGLIK